MRLLVSNGTVVTAAGPVRADIACADGRVAALVEPAAPTQADEVLDASGCLVFPGFIDPHVHSRDPGATDKEDFGHSTMGALAGGITTVLEMPNAIPPVTDAAMFRERARHHERSAWVDFGLWGLSLGRSNIDELEGLFAEGAVAVKLFWGYALDRDTKQLIYNTAGHPPERLLAPPETGDVWDVCREVARVGGLLGAHCEDRHVLDAAQRATGAVETYAELMASRPDTAEAAAIALATELSRSTGCRFHVVHMSSARGAELVRSAQAAGVALTAETCPHYLLLTDASFDLLGPLMKVYPPVRAEADRQALWAAVLDDTISSLGSDHAPHTVADRQGPLGAQPAGMIGVETLVPLLLDEVTHGRLPVTRLTQILAERTARLYGLYPRKGALLPGSDADMTVVDPDASWTIDNEALHAKQPLSPWHGWRVRGMPVASVLRGRVVMRDREPVGERRGRLVRARHQAPATGPETATTR
ncbi:MAG: amidohydrolase family protein [Nitriliruptorales bacterium]|nr:amidohydrolase family protein [Nitriliruptorales bacterium]